MKRLRKNKPECVVFEKARENSGIYYRFTGSVQGFELGHSAEVVPLTSISR